MGSQFDSGYFTDPFVALCQDYPGSDVYPPGDFRVEWGPIFHRGRLDGTARILVIGQDPATTEAATRRILVGAAGQRVQGLLARLGLTRSYVLVNTFLYSVTGQKGGERHAKDPKIAAYRERWFDALLGPNIDAVLALGSLAQKAWQMYAGRVHGRAASVPFEHVRHPTWPESSSRNNAELLAANTKALLKDWNRALEILFPAITRRDATVVLKKYGTAWKTGDLVPIPSDDLPAGLPDWMRSPEPWAKRVGSSAAEKRATLQLRVPDALLPLPAALPAAKERTDLEETEDIADEAPSVHENKREALAFASHPESGPKGHAVIAKALRQYALRGCLVTMGDRGVIKDGVLWIAGGTIAAVTAAKDPAPAGFSGISPIITGATIYPGFMDLHNHLAYGILPLWNVPGSFENRDEWKDESTYDQLVKRPLSLLRELPDAIAAICRYSECKALFGGATTSQGIRLAKVSGAPSYFRGILRNIESPDDERLPRGESRMPDVTAREVGAFFQNLKRYEKRKATFLLHLSEGFDASAHKHFESLNDNGTWSIDRALACIHCVALTADDFKILESNGGSVVWSPFSNLLLYGQTADIPAAKAAGLRIALGCDWSPSGSKNLLEELKVAWLYCEDYRRRKKKSLFKAEELVRMITRIPAEIVRWDAHLGTLEQGKIADLTVLSNKAKNPYENAIQAQESDVKLVVIGGIPRFGDRAIMHELVEQDRDVEDVMVAGVARTIDLETDDERVPRMPFSKAQALLSDALQRLPELEKASPAGKRVAALGAPSKSQQWILALDETESTGVSFRLETTPRKSKPARKGPKIAKAKLPTVPVPLDAPTIADHAGYFDLIEGERNLPDYVKSGLRELYATAVPAPRARPKRAKKATRDSSKARASSGKSKKKAKTRRS